MAFDLDCKKGASRGTVLRDSERLTGWLEEAGCSYLVDESPTGGRHVYVLLEQPVSFAEIQPLAKAIKAAGVLPTFDMGPLVNMTEGCIRPPGSAHRLGGHQELITPLPAATRALSHRTTAASWAAFTALIPRPAPTQLDLTVHLPARDPAAPGQQLPLTPAYTEIATTGRYDSRRYPTPSQARGAVVMHALCRGWSAEQITEQVLTGRWAGLATLYDTKYGTYTRKALAGDIHRCQTKLAETPLQQIHTSATRPRRGEGTAARTHLRRWTWALEAAISTGRWNSARSYGAQLVLLALGDAARRTQTIYPAFGVRHLAMGTGTTLDHSTVAKTLKMLASEPDPFVLLIETDRGVDPDIYELRIPDQHLNDIPDHDADLPPAPYGIHPAFSALPTPAYRLYTALGNSSSPSTAQQLSETAHMPVRTVHATLNQLRAGKLVTCRDGRWRLGRRTLARFAHLNKIPKRLHDLVLRWRREREMLRIAHGLPELRHPHNFTVAWPGIQPPARAPSRPTREQEELAIGGGRANWLTDIENAALQTLRESLGAVLITEHDRAIS